MQRGGVRSRPRFREAEPHDSGGESYFIAAMLSSPARWPIFENNEKSIDCNTRMVVCYDNFATRMNQPSTRVEVPFGGKSLPGCLNLPREPKPSEKFPYAIGIAKIARAGSGVPHRQNAGEEDLGHTLGVRCGSAAA
jgi:hypothetical protein